MNWYKQADLQETLPYFKEFEEMGDYVPDEESIISILENQLGATIVSDIGQGDSGVAYSLSNGDVLKITTNSQEGKVAQYFWDNPNPNVVDYKLVWKDGDLYYIVMSRISEMAVNNTSIKKTFEYVESLIDKNNCTNVECSYKIVESDHFIKPETKQMILNYLSSIISIPFKVFDFLNINNVGIEDGNLIFFDIT